MVGTHKDESLEYHQTASYITFKHLNVFFERLSFLKMIYSIPSKCRYLLTLGPSPVLDFTNGKLNPDQEIGVRIQQQTLSP